MLSRWPAIFAVICLSCLLPAARAMSLRDFQAMAPDAQGKYVADYVLKMKTGIAVKNPALADAIWAYFTQHPANKNFPPGLEDLLVQELAVDKLAKEGRADPSVIQIEGMIVYVVKQRFKA